MLFNELNDTQKNVRVWWNSNGNTTHYYLYNDDKMIENATTIISVLSIREMNDESIDFNVCGLEVFEEAQDTNGNFNGYEWCEYYDDMGQDIKDIIAEREEQN